MDKPHPKNFIDINHYLSDQTANWLCLYTCAKGIPHVNETHHAHIEEIKALPVPQRMRDIAEAQKQELWAQSNNIIPPIYAAIWANIMRVLG